MNQVQSHNNNGLFRKKTKYNRRLFIRRSKIFLSHNHSPILQLKHRRIKRKLFHGEGDELLNEKKHINFTELEQIFDNAIRKRSSIKNLNHPKQESLILNNNLPETRIELSNEEPTEDIHCCLIYNIKQHKILSTISFITLSAFLGFFSVLIFVIK